MSSNWDVEMAKLFKERENVEPFGAVLGDVISVDPLRIAIYGNKIILEEKHCYMCSAMVEKVSRKVEINAADTVGDGVIIFKEIVKVGDKLLCLPTVDGQMFFIIDKVVM